MSLPAMMMMVTPLLSFLALVWNLSCAVASGLRKGWYDSLIPLEKTSVVRLLQMDGWGGFGTDALPGSAVPTRAWQPKQQERLKGCIDDLRLKMWRFGRGLTEPEREYAILAYVKVRLGLPSVMEARSLIGGDRLGELVREYPGAGGGAAGAGAAGAGAGATGATGATGDEESSFGDFRL